MRVGLWTRLSGVVAVSALAACTALPGSQQGSREPVGADCGGAPVPTTSAPASPQSRAAHQRVEGFIRDYYRAWERAGKPGGSFEKWNAERATLAATHLVDEDAFALDEGGLGWPANHDPDREEIRSVSVASGTATVRSEVDNTPERYYTYLLREVGRQWRIERTTMTLDPPTAPVLSAPDHAALLAGVGPDTRLRGHPAAAPSDPGTLFAPPYRVEPVGRITTSGVMTVHDFGWVGFDLAPLSQRVPAGTYPVLVSHRADGLNAALRVRFSDEPATRWVAAGRVGSDNQVAVDAGNVVVLDFTTMPRCRNERIEQLYRDHLASTDGDLFSIAGGPDDAVVVQSGYGDGVYPVYWGVTQDGTITDLVVDFLVD